MVFKEFFKWSWVS